MSDSCLSLSGVSGVGVAFSNVMPVDPVCLFLISGRLPFLVGLDSGEVLQFFASEIIMLISARPISRLLGCDWSVRPCCCPLIGWLVCATGKFSVNLLLIGDDLQKVPSLLLGPFPLREVS